MRALLFRRLLTTRNIALIAFLLTFGYVGSSFVFAPKVSAHPEGWCGTGGNWYAPGTCDNTGTSVCDTDGSGNWDAPGEFGEPTC
jgi:hypothetical protein